MIMKKTIHYSGFIISLVLMLVLLSGYSVDYSPVEKNKNPRLSQKEYKRNLRLQTRKAKLKKRFGRSKSEIQRKRIKKKIYHIEQKQKTDRNPVFGITGFVLSLVAILLFIIWLFAMLFSLVYGYSVLSVLFLLYGAFAAGLTGLILSILGIVLASKRSDIFSARGLSTAGMIIASVILAILLFAAILFFLFL